MTMIFELKAWIRTAFISCLCDGVSVTVEFPTWSLAQGSLAASCLGTQRFLSTKPRDR